MPTSPFLTARWEWLAMFNYAIDPAWLKPHLPPYTEADIFKGKAWVSIVGFLFNDTKVFGLHWPWHTNFEEVNLRYYVKHFDGNEWKRGVGFVSEIVPRPLIAYTANLLYNEHYSVAKMKHRIVQTPETLEVRFDWKTPQTKWNHLSVSAHPTPQPIVAGSEEEFIFEHYLGYNQLNATTTIEYQVVHPRWEVYPVHSFQLDCDVARLYGNDFARALEGKEPDSVFIARGSEVSIEKPKKLRGF
ncbi:MAG: DUF2071 domain-containing protein [Bacteroidota bacterium]|nr:DUF2071 domain-containing protein [Bacteroidota bacterium]